MTALLALLDEQYVCLEAFANAQSRLLNGFSARAHPLREDEERSVEVEDAVERIDSCRQKVQQNLQRLMADEEFSKKHKSHVDLSLRVVRTIARNPSWGAMGIPSHATGVLETNTVALASIRASISIIKELETI
jgi:hypothetical protein